MIHTSCDFSKCMLWYPWFILYFSLLFAVVYCQCVNEFETKEQKLILSEGKFEQQNNHNFIKAK